MKGLKNGPKQCTDGKYPSKGQGALAQYITIAAKQLAHKPASMSFDEAAGLTLTGRTAIEALIDLAQVKEGQSVFINGGSSAVGLQAIQIAKAYGCKVTTSCSGGKIELVKSIGADVVRHIRKPMMAGSLTPFPHAGC